MRLFIELLISFFALLTIYRHLIEPFIEGMNAKRKPYNKPVTETKTEVKSKPSKNIKNIDPKEIQDAEFEEIK
jgi:hypothetical protein